MINLSPQINPNTLATMRANPGVWVAYENKADGHIQFLRVGIGLTYEKAPKAFPNNPDYVFLGTVRLEEGDIVPF